MNASFGKLQSQTLELRDGLNIIEAPNEFGKSTWCAFLLSMFYGINSRERERAGFIPDKTRYAPWSGIAMGGRLDCRVDDTDITLIRTTKRQAAPLGEFRAVYAGTGDPVPHLTGTSCGETLLGVSREVFERSAFIRQSGLAITQDAGLERRIAALITSGEEGTSYSEAMDTLKKQLNRRRHNRTGQIPVLEGQLQETESQLAEANRLAAALMESEKELELLCARETALTEELTQAEQWEAAQRWKALEAAEAFAVQAEEAAQALHRQLTANHTPENETIGRLRGALVNLETTRKAVEKARAERDETAKVFLRAESVVNESPFAGQTAEDVRREIGKPPKVSCRLLLPTLISSVILLTGGFLCYYLQQLIFLYTGGAIAVLVGGLMCIHARNTARRKALEKRFGTADPDSIQKLADTYFESLVQHEQARIAADKASAAAETLYETLSSNEQAILLEIRRFAPAAFDVSAADELLRQCAQQRKALAEAEAAAQKARIRAEMLSAQMPPKPQAPPANAPVHSRETISDELRSVQASILSARSAADRQRGQLQTIGDSTILQSAVQHLQGQISTLYQEYEAISLAMNALETANTALQNRFSPELGRRAAEIFTQLTDQRYSGVVLDRTFHLSAEPTGDAVYRDAALLSAGTVDQLYLATRLAICDLVLPAETAAPIILDDALANFDDERCAAALKWLKRSARDRQILLFTCHSREAAFFSNDPEVFVQQLTNPV